MCYDLLYTGSSWFALSTSPSLVIIKRFCFAEIRYFVILHVRTWHHILCKGVSKIKKPTVCRKRKDEQETGEGSHNIYIFQTISIPIVKQARNDTCFVRLQYADLHYNQSINSVIW